MVSLDTAYRSFREVLAGLHRPFRYATLNQSSSPRFPLSSSRSPRLRNSWLAKALGTYAFAGIYAGNCTTVPVPIARDF